MLKKYLFLFDRLGLDNEVSRDSLRLICGVVANESGQARIAREIVNRIRLRAINLSSDDLEFSYSEVLSDVKAYDYSCLAEDFVDTLASFGLLLASSFKDVNDFVKG